MDDLRPQVDFRHILQELSINQKDPCEVIRELISNAYDARAKHIRIYTLLPNNGFIFFDDGVGMSLEKNSFGVSPYEAFFSIGKSTKVRNKGIGYKCQGSKLCFASKKVTLITRCKGEESWRFFKIDNPNHNLSMDTQITPKAVKAPWQQLEYIFSPKRKDTEEILKSLNEDFFNEHFVTGTLIIVEGLEIHSFEDYFSTSKPGPYDNKDEKLIKDIPSWQFSYIYNYIRFNTRHGDVRILDTKAGFTSPTQTSFEYLLEDEPKCELLLWVKKDKDYYGLEIIEPGFPYLEPDKQTKLELVSPLALSRLSNGRFYSRHAKIFEHDGVMYSVILAIDGKRRALEKYISLGRKGNKKSGIRLTDHRGSFIASQGIKICSYDEIFENPNLREYEELILGKEHYILIINGSFDLVTDRNKISESSLKILKKDSFVREIKKFLDDVQDDKDKTFADLLKKLKNDKEQIAVEDHTSKFNSLKDEIQDRERFRVNDIDLLKDKWIVCPVAGEENWVSALHTLFAHLVPSESQLAPFWLVPRTMSGGSGLDSIGVSVGEYSLAPKVHKGLEYKYKFNFQEEFNHPLIITDQIVCWEIIPPPLTSNNTVCDIFKYYGSVKKVDNQPDNMLYEIFNIEHRQGGKVPNVIKVINLKELIKNTFNIELSQPPPQITENKSKKRKSKFS